MLEAVTSQAMGSILISPASLLFLLLIIFTSIFFMGNILRLSWNMTRQGKDSIFSLHCVIKPTQLVNLNLRGVFLLNRTVSERVKHILRATLARLHVLWKTGGCVECLRCWVGAWLASENEAGVRVTGWSIGIWCMGSHLWRWTRSLIRRDISWFRIQRLHKSIVEIRMHWWMSSLSRPLIAGVECSSVLCA